VACDGHIASYQKGIREMQLSHAGSAMSAVFDDPNLVSCAGLVPVLELAQRCGLADLVADGVTLRERGGVNAHLKVPALVAGMVAGADSIDDMDLLRHGGMDRLFDGVRAPSGQRRYLPFQHWSGRWKPATSLIPLDRLLLAGSAGDESGPAGHLRGFDHGAAAVFEDSGNLPDGGDAGIETEHSAIRLERGTGSGICRANGE